MNWQPPPPPPRPGGGAPPPGGYGGGGGQGAPQGAPQGASGPAVAQKAAEDLSLYELLQVDRDAHATIIKYAYRFLAAMYHPDNGETGDADKFRMITEAFRTLSDEGKRQAYDMSLGSKEKAEGKAPKAPKEKVNEFGKGGLPNIPKTGVTWNEIELRLGVLQVLLAARKKRPTTGGASGKMLMDCLNIDTVTEIEFALWYLREKGLVEMGERAFMITAMGLDYLTDQLGKTQVLDGGTKTEQKLNSGVQLPATLK